MRFTYPARARRNEERSTCSVHTVCKSLLQRRKSKKMYFFLVSVFRAEV